MRRLIKPVVGFLCTVSMTSMAYAQDIQDNQPAQDQEQTESTTPEEEAQADENVILVTATLRATDVQDIPLAVTAVSPVELDRQGIKDIKTLGSISSSFSIQSTQTESQGTSIRIRGVGTTGNNIGLESSVGVFIDGVYQSRPGVALGDMVDLERLEVLRGPQGTQFGRNTSAGALNISTKKPDLYEFTGYGNASYGNRDAYNAQAVVNLPVIEGVAGLRLAGSYRNSDGILHSATTPGVESGTRDRYTIRGQLLFEPTPDISIRIIGDYQESNEECCDAVIARDLDLSKVNPALSSAAAWAAYGLPANGGVAIDGNTALERRLSNGEQFINDTQQWGVSGQIDWDFGFAKLTSITAYRDFDFESVQEADFVGIDVLSVGLGTNATNNTTPFFDKIQTFTQELRLQGSAFGDRLDWLIGGFYSNEDIVEDFTVTLGKDYQAAASINLYPALAGNGGYIPGTGTLNPLLALTAIANGGVPIDITGSYANNHFTQDAESWSIFTHNIFYITDNLNFTAGLRYSDEKKDGSYTQLSAANPACSAIAGAILDGTFAAAMVPTALSNGGLALSCFPFASIANEVQNLPLGPGGAVVPVDVSSILPTPRQFADRFDDDELIWTVQLAWEPNYDYLVYGSFTHGYKSGGFNLDSSAAVGGSDPRFDSEEVDSYEVGIKSTLFDGRARANLALFYMDMSNFQVLNFTGTQFRTFNVDKVKSYGAELEVNANWTDHLSTNTAITLLEATYGDNCGASGRLTPDLVTLLCGEELTNSPNFTGIFGMTWDGPVTSSGWGLLLNANIRYESARKTDTFSHQFDTAGVLVPKDFAFQEANFKVNARIGITTPDERFTLEFWGRNIFDERTHSVSFNVPLRGIANYTATGAYLEEPLSYGVTLRGKF